MVTYKPTKGIGVFHIIGTMLLCDVLIMIMIFLINSYVISSLMKLFLIIFNVYQVYYILLFTTLRYGIDDENIYILDIFKKNKIPYENIEGYKINSGNINGIKLSGFCTNFFALGKTFVKKIGTTNMYVTSNKNIVYLKSSNTTFAISPLNYEEFEKAINLKGIQTLEWEYKWNKDVSLHKDKSFMIPFFIVSIIVVILTLNPFVLYLMNKLPQTMPLSFDSSFLPLEIGTGKQFAFSQMVYGVLNMAIQFCMYYASYFYAKYDRKSTKKFIYAALAISTAFLLIQIRILHAFK
jgi:hypothetical protein